ncbi:MAG TPA: glycosyltransferase, partial [Stellaceae bacterium]|nr:glycosyltransferase [Stellaceae bacterium]
DVRPYAAHASVVVAPLRVARGIQNKVLEGMAMARPVVASAEALEGIRLEIGSDALRADTPADFADAICTAASAEAAARLGANARRRVLADFTWAASLRRLDACVDG